MRIVIVTGIFPPDIGGPASYVPTIAKHLAQSSWNVSVLTLSEEPQPTDTDANWGFQLNRIKRRMWLPIRFISTVKRLISLSKDADIIFANGLFLESLLASKLTSKPLVLKIVGDPSWERAQNKGWYTDSIDVYQSDGRKSLKLRLMDLSRSIPVRLAQAVITPSSYLRDIALGWGLSLNRSHVILNAVPLPAVHQLHNPSSERPYDIIVVGRLVPWKGVDTALRVIARLKSVSLLIVGDGPLRIILERLAKELEIQDRVNFTGALDRQETMRKMRLSKVFLLNSSYEGMPHAVIEAAACGCEIVASASGGTKELLKNYIDGYLFEYNDAEAMERGLRERLHVFESRMQGNQNRDIDTLISSFSLSRMTGNTTDLLLEISSLNVKGAR